MRLWCKSTDYPLKQCLYSLRASVEITVASLPFRHSESLNCCSVLEDHHCQDSKKSDVVLEDFGSHLKVWDWLFRIKTCRPSEMVFKISNGQLQKPVVKLAAKGSKSGIQHAGLKYFKMNPNPASRARTQYFPNNDFSNFSCQTIGDETCTSHSKVPHWKCGEGGRGCSNRQVMFSYHTF